jgi:hypothetical protein
MDQLVTLPFKLEHREDLGPPQVSRMSTLIEEAAEHELIAPHLEMQARTAFVAGDGAVAAWGIFPMWDGVGSLWVWFTPKTSRYIRQIIKKGNAELELAHEILDYKRVQVEIETSLGSTRKFAELLGFEYEGLMKSYGKNGVGDYWLLARTF